MLQNRNTNRWSQQRLDDNRSSNGQSNSTKVGQHIEAPICHTPVRWLYLIAVYILETLKTKALLVIVLVIATVTIILVIVPVIGVMMPKRVNLKVLQVTTLVIVVILLVVY